MTTEACAEDGTPVTDLLVEMKELKARITEMKGKFRTISNLCKTPHWSVDRRWKICDLADVGAKL